MRLSGIGPVDANAVGTVGAVGLELKFEHDSDWSELGNKDVGDDPDSNSEGYYGNDYPEARIISSTVLQFKCSKSMRL